MITIFYLVRQGQKLPPLLCAFLEYNEALLALVNFPMIEELKDEELIGKIGGRFRLSALIQKRLVALNEGTPSAIDYGRNASAATRDRLNTVIQEILQDKIFLDTESNLQARYEAGVDMVLDTEFTEGY